MKTVGVIGGLGPESTVDYYQSIIAKYQERMGSKEVLPEILINSINMYQVFDFITSGQLDGLATYLADAVNNLEKAGADFALISANTPHIVFDQVVPKVNIPLISIVEETYQKAVEHEINRIGLIGTSFTMGNDFFKKPFVERGKEIIVPDESDQQYIHEKIVKELENGVVLQETKEKLLGIIHTMIERDRIQGIILGCTELPMIIKQDDLDIFMLNTSEIHVNKVIDTMFLVK